MIAFADMEPGHPEVTRTAAIALWMAIWWMTEAVPLVVTSLLPIVLFPTLGIMSGKSVAPIYFNDIIALFIGGFLVALAMEKWQLHRRIALWFLRRCALGLRGLLLGTMVSTAFISMWISNTATAMMMVPIGMALTLKLEESLGRERLGRYPTGLFLGIAYGANIGGIATLVGTPTNLIFPRILSISFPNAPAISFASWFFFGFPASAAMLVLAWLLLARLYCPRGEKIVLDRRIFEEEYEALGPIPLEEGIVLADFLLLALLWIFRQDIPIGGVTIPGWSDLFGNPDYLDDGTVAIAMALLLFLIPARRTPGERIIGWETATRLPWDIVLLFGGGFALAEGFISSGLSLWLGTRLEALGAFHPLILIAGICALATFLTELASNMATAQVLLPIIASMAMLLRINPILPMIAATISCSMGFMLPVGTPPNAIVFGTGRVTISEMIRTGLLIDILAILIVAAAAYFLGPPAFDASFDTFPDWAIQP